MAIRSIADLDRLRKLGEKSLRPPERIKLLVSVSSCCDVLGKEATYRALMQHVEEYGLRQHILVSKVGCNGWCRREPAVGVSVPGYPLIVCGEITPELSREFVRSLARGEIDPSLYLYRVETEQAGARNRQLAQAHPNAPPSLSGASAKLHVTVPIEKIPRQEETGFFRKQLKLTTRNCGHVSPEQIAEYIAEGGYYSLYRCLKELLPEEVIDLVTRAGLRGRGGAGFPTGPKWQYTRRSKEHRHKFVICNAEEGEPAIYKDRSILEGDPHSIIEGMTIAGYATGAREGYININNEFSLALQRVPRAIEQAESCGLLGRGILGSNFDFTINVRVSPGGYISGEESALIETIEGRVGKPRMRPPFPPQEGLLGEPTCVNNVETLANIPLIIANGSEWYSAIGTEKSKGTKVFSLVGKVREYGMVEVPMGTTLRELVYEIGGGITNNNRFKAIHLGGPSGGSIPEQFIDLPLDYDEIAKTGAMLGSGGMVVFDNKVCMVDVARYFLSFNTDESCGKCVPCRIGTHVMHEILSRIVENKGHTGDIELLQELSHLLGTASFCGLGQAAPTPVISTIRHFRHEYEHHLREKRCAAGSCEGEAA